MIFEGLCFGILLVWLILQGQAVNRNTKMLKALDATIDSLCKRVAELEGK